MEQTIAKERNTIPRTLKKDTAMNDIKEMIDTDMII